MTNFFFIQVIAMHLFYSEGKKNVLHFANMKLVTLAIEKLKTINEKQFSVLSLKTEKNLATGKHTRPKGLRAKGINPICASLLLLYHSGKSTSEDFPWKQFSLLTKKVACIMNWGSFIRRKKRDGWILTTEEGEKGRKTDTSHAIRLCE